MIPSALLQSGSLRADIAGAALFPITWTASRPGSEFLDGRVARTRVPASPEALAALPTTGYVDGASGRVWPWYVADGLGGSQQFTPTAPAFLTDDPEAERDAVLAGVGYAQLPHYLVAAELASGRLVTALDDFAPPAWDVFVYRPQRGPVPPRIRRVFDTIVEALSDPVPASA